MKNPIDSRFRNYKEPQNPILRKPAAACTARAPMSRGKVKA